MCVCVCVCVCVIYMVCYLWCVCVWVGGVCRGVGTLIRISEGAKGSKDEAFCTVIY